MVTLILMLMMCVLLFFMIWSATYFYPWTGLLTFFPNDIEEKARQHKPPFPTAPVIGWVILVLCVLGFVGVIVFGVKAFDIIGLDYILITKTGFFQYYIPETKGCAGYHSFGYNRKEQLKQILTLPFAALLTAWVCTLF